MGSSSASKTVRSKVWVELAKQRLGGNQFNQKEQHVHMHEELSEKNQLCPLHNVRKGIGRDQAPCSSTPPSV